MRVTGRLRQHYHQHLSLSRQIAIRALLAFLLTLAVVRGVTYCIHYHILPFRDLVTKSGLHIHHLFWGILLLMLVGFGALATRAPAWHLRLALVYGVALALTLDEFALWLRLADVYWSPEGRESLEAIAVAAALLALLAVGLPFWRAVARDMGIPFRGGAGRT
ncbi:MAG TPA: hypothetical protein VN375_12255 [Vicinamibacteria bacterium]|nr:hypothetical protein [Vicinamibacteria bacterium]